MKKYWILCLLCIFCMGYASAEGTDAALEIEITANPYEIVEPQEITLSFTLKNTTESIAENVCLAAFDGVSYEPLGQIAAGETLSITRTHAVTQDELNAGGIAYIISHDDVFGNSEKVNYTVTTDIAKADPLPDVEFTRHISDDIAEVGDSVTIAYRVRNTGNVALHTLCVRDPLGDFIGRADVLGAGETKVFLSHIMPTEDCVSVPEFSYTIPMLNADACLLSLDAHKIHVEAQDISAAFTLTQYDDTAQLSLTLSCVGGGDWFDIAVYDDIRGERIADHLTLDGSLGVKTITKTEVLRGDTDFRWRITARDTVGKPVELRTETLSAHYAPSHSPTRVSLIPQSERIEIGRAGRVRIGFSVVNSGDTAHDVVLSEATLGDLYTFAVVPSGEPTCRDMFFDISEDTVLQFSVRTGDSDISEPVSVDVAIVRGAPNPEEPLRGDGIFFGMSEKLRDMSVYVIMLAAACAVLVVLTIILLVQRGRQRTERKIRRRLRDASDAAQDSKPEA